jgi:hypothetical protein
VEVVGKKAKLAAAAWESTGDIWRHLETGLVTHHLSIQSELAKVWCGNSAQLIQAATLLLVCKPLQVKSR